MEKRDNREHHPEQRGTLGVGKKTSRQGFDNHLQQVQAKKALDRSAAKVFGNSAEADMHERHGDDFKDYRRPRQASSEDEVDRAGLQDSSSASSEVGELSRIQTRKV